LTKLKDKYVLIISLVINLLIRIPKMLYAQGPDGFLAIWEAKLILNGDYFSNGFDFFSLLGVYPNSGYPIGSLLILCLCLLMTGKRVMLSILLFDTIFTVIFTYCVYYLANTLELKSPKNLYFTLLITTLPTILDFSYYQSSARFPFFALLPLVFAFLIHFIKKKKIVYLAIAVVISFCLNFLHEMALMLIPIILIAIFIYLVEIITKRDFIFDLHNKEILINQPKIDEVENRKSKAKKHFTSLFNYIKQRFWIFSIIIFSLIGFVIFGLNPSNVIEASKFNIYCYLKVIIDCDIAYIMIQPFVDQWIHYGIVFVLFFVSIILMCIPKFNNLLKDINNNSSIIKLICFILPFFIVYQIVYSYYFLIYIVAIVVAIFLQNVSNKKYRLYIFPVCGLISSIFIALYHLLVAKVLPYFIVGLFVGIISFISLFLLASKKVKMYFRLKIGNSFNKYHFNTIIIFAIILFNSVFILDRHVIYSNFDNIYYTYMTEEEVDISNFLLENGFGTFDSFDTIISTRIAALSGWYFIQDTHSRSVFLLENRTLDELDNRLTPISSWLKLQFFNSTATYGRAVLYSLINDNCYSIQSLMILKAYNLKYFISLRSANTSYIWERTIESVFIRSLYDYVPIVKTTENFYIWNTSTLYS